MASARVGSHRASLRFLRSALPPLRPPSLPRSRTNPRGPGPLLSRRPRRLSTVEKTRPPRFLDDPCVHAPLFDPGGPPVPGHYRTGGVVFRRINNVDSAFVAFEAQSRGLHALCVGGMLQRGERGARRAAHHRRFFPRPRARSMLRRWMLMPNRARTSSTRSAALSSGCSLLAVCNASTTSSLSLWGRRGTRPVRQQSRQPARLVSALRLVPGGAGDAEAGRGVAYRHVVLAHAAQHLVLDLEQIARVEERIRQEQLVAHRLGMRVQAAVVLEDAGRTSASSRASGHHVGSIAHRVEIAFIASPLLALHHVRSIPLYVAERS